MSPFTEWGFEAAGRVDDRGCKGVTTSLIEWTKRDAQRRPLRVWSGAWILPLLLTGATCAGVAVSGGPAIAQSGGAEFGSRSACEQAGRFPPDQCANAFLNAQAEWDEGTPRFASRGDCEKRFGRCQIAGMKGGKPSFQPVMNKVRIHDRGSNRTVVPVAPPGAQGLVRFSERSILQRRTERSDRKQQEAQKRFEAAWSAADAAGQPQGLDAGADWNGFVAEKPEPFDPNWQKQEGVRTYPGPKARQATPPPP